MDGKSCQNKKFTPPSSYVHSFLSTTKYLEKIRLHLHFLWIFYKRFLNKPKFKIFKKCPLFLYSLLIMTITCFYFKVCSQELWFMTLNKTFHPVNPTNLEYPLYLISWQATKFQLEWSQVKFHKICDKKREWKKEENKHKKRQGLKEYKGAENKNFAWENFNHSMLLTC